MWSRAWLIPGVSMLYYIGVSILNILQPVSYSLQSRQCPHPNSSTLDSKPPVKTGQQIYILIILYFLWYDYSLFAEERTSNHQSVCPHSTRWGSGPVGCPCLDPGSRSCEEWGSISY